jgi:hypothetical protein
VATNKLSLFLYSPGNIAGCLLALGGLGLFFLGIIHPYWWAIVAGLYAAGVLGWPRNSLAQVAEHTELSPNLVAHQLHRLVDSVLPGLPNEAIALLRSIEATLHELLPRLKALREIGIISPKDSFTVVETVRRYLPDTLGAYLRLPRLYANMQPLANGKTASQGLLDQLLMLDKSLKVIAQSAFEGDAQKLVSNGQFLQNKFAEKMVFRP